MKTVQIKIHQFFIHTSRFCISDSVRIQELLVPTTTFKTILKTSYATKTSLCNGTSTRYIIENKKRLLGSLIHNLKNHQNQNLACPGYHGHSKLLQFYTKIVSSLVECAFGAEMSVFLLYLVFSFIFQ